MTGRPFALRELGLDDMRSAARVHRAAFDDSFPWIGSLHTAEEDLAYWTDHLLKTTSLWGAQIDNRLIGVIAFDSDWIEQLYVDPPFQNMNAGSALLSIAQSKASSLRLWTFQRNQRARRFYEVHGFIATEMTDGCGNEEKEPDVLYCWERTSA